MASSGQIEKSVYLFDGWMHEYCTVFLPYKPDDMTESDYENLYPAFWSSKGAPYNQRFSLQIDKMLLKTESEFQEIVVFYNKTYGNVLVLDGAIQCTEKDECSYQEMLAHLALCSHQSPKKVLVIGGGDGGVVREIVKHECVEDVVLCEIDQEVINVCKKFLPYMSYSLDHPKVSVHVANGVDFIKNQPKNYYDIIITDSTDPLGPGEALYDVSYYSAIRDALSEDGIMCSQGSMMWLDSRFIAHCYCKYKSLFAQVAYAFSSMPTYASGNIGYFLCAKNSKFNLKTPVRKVDHKSMNLKYYDSKVHEAAFVLPQFLRKAIKDAQV